MSRFMGGFATAAVILTAAAIAGRLWLIIACAASAVVPPVWLLARASRRRHATRPALREPYADPPGVFRGREETVPRMSPDRR